MSWASHNPEKWDEICVEGIARKIGQVIHDLEGIDLQPEDLLSIGHILYHESTGKVQDALMQWANKEISSVESDYWADLADAAHERGKP